MKKSTTAARPVCLALFGCLTLFALLPTVGCGSGAAAKIENVPVNEKAWADKPVDPNKIVDSQVSWKKFVAEAKQPERSKNAEEKFKGQVGPNATLKLVFMKDEIEYVKFGDKSPVKNIDPKKLYEVGVITLAAKEDWGAEGFQIREYTLKFITPQRDGNWRFAYGTYMVQKFSGTRNADPMVTRMVEERDFQNGHLREIFAKPLPVKPGAVAPQGQGGEAPVETQVPK